MSLLSIDIGSSRCKAVAFAATGEILAQHSCGYALSFPAPAHAEIDPDLFWQAVCSTLQAVTRELAEPVQAVCFSSHGETLVPVNAQNVPVAATILNQDNRATAEAASMETLIGRERLFEITGLVTHSMYPVPKLLWLKRHNPTIFQASTRFLSVIGYILSRLNLPPYIDYSLASRYLAFDVRQKRWSEEILSAVGLSEENLPIPVPAGSIVGKLETTAARMLGVQPGTMVVLGGHDQPSGALGVGAIEAGRVVDSMGTYECLLAVSVAPVLSKAALAVSLNSYCHVVPEKFVTIAYFPSGIMTKWFHDLLFGSANSSEVEAEHYRTLELEMSSRPSGLCITPNLIGTCNPDFNPHTRAVISGLGSNTTRGDIYKGILEGIACEFAAVSSLFTDIVGYFQDIHVTGGGAISVPALQLRAALASRSLHTMQCPEAVCLGGAILGGVAAGAYTTMQEAVQQMVRKADAVSPNPCLAAAYTQQVQQYHRVRTGCAFNAEIH